MDPRAQELFEAVVNLTPEERAAYLADACKGNDALRHDVESLVDSHLRAGDFFRDPTITPDHAAGLPATILHEGNGEPMFVSLSEKPGDMIGRYRLLQEIGEGGFGVVFMAEQTEPVTRKVALKIIKLGMDTRERIARFDAERQALAMMDHPNIARVFDAGATATGRLFFVMELVDGHPITEYCDTMKLTIEQRLGLFRQVCSAVQHAHQKGIIHRDIKPSNVLVTVVDGQPVPKVIDFGIAKAVNVRLTARTLFTEFRQVIGTPDYMSPEQATNSTGDIDTRSDVYSLGVLLYELLTGVTPFDFSHHATLEFERIQKVIREDDPLKPSLRMSGESSRNIATLRRSDSRKLESQLRGDLDWIVMKCLEKDRARRYGTAQALADDVLRCLSDEPVLAGPPSTRYRVWKFYKRHRAAVIVTAAFTGFFLMGIVAQTLTLQKIREQRDESQLAQGAAQSTAAKLGLALVSSLNSTQGLLAQEQVLVPLEAFDNDLANAPLKRLPKVEYDIRKMLAVAYESLGKKELAIAQFDKLGRRSGDTATLKQNWSTEIAEALYEQANFRDTAGDKTNVTAISRRALNYLEEAHQKGTVLYAKTQSALAAAISEDDPDEAAKLLGEAIVALRSLPADADQEPLAEALYNLSVVSYIKQQYSQAIAPATESLKIRRTTSTGDRAELVRSLSLLALLNHTVKYEDNPVVDSLIAEVESIAQTWPKESSHWLDLLNLYTNVSYVLVGSGGSVSHMKKKLEDEVRHAERLVPTGNQDLCQAMIVLAMIYEYDRNDAEEERWRRKALDMCRMHDEWSPFLTRRTRSNLAEFYAKRDRFPESIAYCRELVELDKRTMNRSDLTEEEREQAKQWLQKSTEQLIKTQQQFDNLIRKN